MKIIAAAILATLPLGASAATVASPVTYELTMTSTDPLYGSTVLTYVDSDGNMLLSASEILSFAGFTFEGSLWTTVLNVPKVTGFAVGVVDEKWVFKDSTGTLGLSVDVSTWTYSLAAVPLPASAVLLLGALGALGFARRRRAAV
jgi:hypothetical protein